MITDRQRLVAALVYISAFSDRRPKDILKTVNKDADNQHYLTKRDNELSQEYIKLLDSPYKGKGL